MQSEGSPSRSESTLESTAKSSQVSLSGRRAAAQREGRVPIKASERASPTVAVATSPRIAACISSQRLEVRLLCRLRFPISPTQPTAGKPADRWLDMRLVGRLQLEAATARACDFALVQESPQSQRPLLIPQQLGAGDFKQAVLSS